jgi:hypothetical protein
VGGIVNGRLLAPGDYSNISKTPTEYADHMTHSLACLEWFRLKFCCYRGTTTASN